LPTKRRPIRSWRGPSRSSAKSWRRRNREVVMAQTLIVTSPTRKQGRPLLTRRAGAATVFCLLVLSFLLGCAVLAKDADQKTTPARANRRPIGLVLAEDGRWLFVATQRGTICTIDTSNSQLVGEAPIGRKLADLTMTPDGNRLLAVDEDAGELLILSRRGLSVQSSGQVKVSPAPVSVQVAPDGSRCTVASLWSRRLTVVALDKEPRVIRTVDLPFAPRKQLLVREGA